MLGWVRSLFGKSNNTASKRAAHARPRSATGDVLAQRRRPVEAQSAAQRNADGTDFDPYNTGKFDRAASWERVRNSHR